MKITVTGFQFISAGHGHNKVTVYTLEGSYSTVTSNTRLTDAYNGDDETPEWEQARQQLAELVLDANNVEYEGIEYGV